jgi:phospholipid-transporting ATPase
LRTLLIATRNLDNDFFDDWSKRYNNAMLFTSGKEEALAKLAQEVEIDFELIGSTAIEDKLQEDVG